MDKEIDIIDDDKLRKDAAVKNGLPETATWDEIDVAVEKILNAKDAQSPGSGADASEDTIDSARKEGTADEISI